MPVDSTILGAAPGQHATSFQLHLILDVIPSIFIGAEAWYLRHYDGSFFNAFTGDAIFVGPTLYAQLGPKAFMTAAWNAQVSGHDVDVPGSGLNFGEFTCLAPS